MISVRLSLHGFIVLVRVTHSSRILSETYPRVRPWALSSRILFTTYSWEYERYSPSEARMRRSSFDDRGQVWPSGSEMTRSFISILPKARLTPRSPLILLQKTVPLEFSILILSSGLSGVCSSLSFFQLLSFLTSVATESPKLAIVSFPLRIKPSKQVVPSVKQFYFA